MTIAPIVQTIETRASPDQAFGLFTKSIGTWWPGKTVGAKPHVAIVIEPHPEGRWFERDADGAETLWGKVLVWEPPSRLVLAWQLHSRFSYDPNFLTEVEVTFRRRDAGGTVVRLEHRNLEQYGADAERLAKQIHGGWGEKLGGFLHYADGVAVAA